MQLPEPALHCSVVLELDGAEGPVTLPSAVILVVFVSPSYRHAVLMLMLLPRVLSTNGDGIEKRWVSQSLVRCLGSAGPGLGGALPCSCLSHTAVGRRRC